MADVEVGLRWTGVGMQFDGNASGGPVVRVDGHGVTGPSPMQTLLLALAGCSAADVVEILGKMRVPLEALNVRVEGERAPKSPRRYTRVRVVYETRGVPAEHTAKLERAVALSHETYCSVLHTLRADVAVASEVVRG